MRPDYEMSLLASRAERIRDDLRRPFLIPSDARKAAAVISELAAVVVEMSREIEELTAQLPNDRPEKKPGASKLAIDLVAARDEIHVLKQRIRDMAELIPRERYTHRAVDNLGSSSSLEALVGCGSSYRGKTQIGVGSYRAKMHGVNS